MGCGCRGQAQSGATAAVNYEAIPAAAGTVRRVFASQSEAEVYVASNGGGHTKPTSEPVTGSLADTAAQLGIGA